MSCTITKLCHLDETKQMFRALFEEKNIPVSDSDTFRSYVDKAKLLGEFAPLDICKIAASNSRYIGNSQIYFYKPTREFNAINNNSAYTLMLHNYQMRLGLSAANITPDHKRINCNILIQSSYDTGEYISYVKSDENWLYSASNTTLGYGITLDVGDMFYSDTALTDCHPFLADNGFSTVGEPVEIQADLSCLKFGDLYNTKITADNSVIIFLFNDGNKYLYKYPKTEKIVFTKNSGTYSFSQDGNKTRLDWLLSNEKFYKSSMRYDSSSGITLDPLTEQILVATSDIYDDSGNLLFAKNADIEEFI